MWDGDQMMQHAAAVVVILQWQGLSEAFSMWEGECRRSIGTNRPYLCCNVPCATCTGFHHVLCAMQFFDNANAVAAMATADDMVSWVHWV
jgi:hypothetical protein